MKSKKIYVDVRNVDYTQDSIQACFQDGTSVQDTIEKLRKNPKETIKELPPIRVVQNKKRYTSLDNRRLYCFKQVLSRKPLQARIIPVVQVHLQDSKIKQEYNKKNTTVHKKIRVRNKTCKKPISF